MKAKKQRADDQAVSSFSASKPLMAAMEAGRKALQMDRSNFIRYCVAKELKNLGIKVEE